MLRTAAVDFQIHPRQMVAVPLHEFCTPVNIPGLVRIRTSNQTALYRGTQQWHYTQLC